MSPMAVLNPVLYADRTVQDWHRSLDESWGAIDVDLLGYCRRCRKSLYLTESTTNPNKFAGVLLRLGQDAGVPVLIIFHRNKLVTGAKMLHPRSATIGSETELRHVLDQFRNEHNRNIHPKEAK